jgi:diguanylate cyclase (GGDEF)-like protein
MMHRPTDANGDGPGERILLVGDLCRVFSPADGVADLPWESRASILEALDVVAREPVDIVAVVVETISDGLGAALRALRQTTAARVVLLVQMVQEPVARRLTSTSAAGEKLADAYLICPTTVIGFAERLREALGQPVVHPTGPERSDTALTPERQARYLELLATTDDLTGLKNRRYVFEFARQVVEHARRSGGRVTLLLFDIDNFKRYNDTCGHLKGDEILRQAAILMRRCCRVHDVVGRIGGDEFAVVFWDDPAAPGPQRQEDRRRARADHPAEAISVAKRFQKEFGKAEVDQLGPEGQGVLTISGGLASFPRDGASVEELLRRADMALLRAKRRGKNRIYLVGEAPSDIADLP